MKTKRSRWAPTISPHNYGLSAHAVAALHRGRKSQGVPRGVLGDDATFSGNKKYKTLILYDQDDPIKIGVVNTYLKTLDNSSELWENRKRIDEIKATL
jgi:hypothetical protein